MDDTSVNEWRRRLRRRQTETRKARRETASDYGLCSRDTIATKERCQLTMKASSPLGFAGEEIIRASKKARPPVKRCQDQPGQWWIAVGLQ